MEGGTVEEAIKKAAEIFNVSRDEISVKVVCEEKRGLFGMEGGKTCKNSGLFEGQEKVK